MNLFGLCEQLGESTPSRAVPPWSLGCFERRSIVFHTGQSDETTRVIWLQSHGLTADFRLAPDLPLLRSPADLTQCSAAELRTLLEAEAGVARTHWDGAQMSWHDWTSFQVHDKWPEPGILRRVGSSLVEFAPSGAYVEDWRLQSLCRGPLIALRLLEERELRDGALRHRGGALIVAGQCAAWIRGRPKPLGGIRRISDLLRQAPSRELLDRVFSFVGSFGISSAPGSEYVCTVSTSSWTIGEPLLSLDGFERDTSDPSRLVQNTPEVVRLFEVETIQFDPPTCIETAASDAAREWLVDEAGTLLRLATRPA